MPVIALLTDFGTRDHYVGVVKGQVLRHCPSATLVDVSHEIPPYSVPAARYLLEQALGYFPQGTIFLVVVDPGVGSSREVLLLRTAEAFVLAPHNGLLDTVISSGRVESAWTLRPSGPLASNTFHARDLFAPVVGRLAAGDDLSHILVACQPAPAGSPDVCFEDAGGLLRGEVIWIDHYGNLVTSLPAAAVPASWDPDRVRGRAAGGEIRRRVTCYEQGPAETPFFIVGSAGRVEISRKQGSAAEALGARVGCRVEMFLE